VKALLYLVLALILASGSLGLTLGIAYIVQIGVMPAIAAGSLDVNTDFLILDHHWRGNEIYILLAIYLFLVLGMTWSATLMVKKVWQGVMEWIRVRKSG
jgi:hypothetical protein